MTPYEKRIEVAEKEAAVDAIQAGKKTQTEVARRYDVSRQAVSNWVKQSTGGHVLGTRGRPAMVPLTAAEKKKLRAVIRSDPPSKAGIKAKRDQWTFDAVRTLLHQERDRWYTEFFIEPLMEEWGLLDDASALPGSSAKKKPTTQRHRKKTKTPRKMSQDDLSYYEEQVRKTQAMMKDRGVVLDEDVAPGHGVRSGKHAKGTIQQRRKKKRKRKRRE